MRISDWSSDVCSSDLEQGREGALAKLVAQRRTEDRRKLRLQFLFGADRGVHAHRIGDAEAREGVDLQPLLVGRKHLLALHVHAEDALVDILDAVGERSEEHTSELQSLMSISYADFCLKK